MNLKDLEGYEEIVIQCHDNPDADTLGAGYGLYCFYKDRGKKVRMVYSGRSQIRKSNLVLLLENVAIPVEYVSPADIESGVCLPELGKENSILITVDCQYGAGNVTKILAMAVAVIDHHQVEIEPENNPIIRYHQIRSDLASCSTLVWDLLRKAGYQADDEAGLGSALYYGLYTDSNQLTEVYNPLDRDMMDQIPHDNSLIMMLKNSNLSLSELEVAGIAMLRYSFNEEYGFAVIKSQPCDPNILGLISDFLLQVDKIRVCVVFNETNDGYKLSVRSCIKEVNASELAAFLTNKIGSGGGHYEKAGGFISRKLYHEQQETLHIEAYINSRMTEYFDTYEIIYAKDYEADPRGMKVYEKKKLPLGFVRARDVLPVGTPITVRSLEGDIDQIVEDDLIIMIGVKGEVYPNREEKFLRSNEILDRKYVYEECTLDHTYVPTIKNRITGQNHLLTEYAHVCVPTGSVKIYAKQLERGVKVFTAWDKEKYMLGKPGDYLAVRFDDLHDVYVIEEKIFGQTYQEVNCDNE